MKRLTILTLLIACGASAPVSAQYYEYGPGPGYRNGPPPDYGRPPPPGYGDGYGRGGYGREGYGGGGYGPPRYSQGRGGSTVCYTSRGNCPIGVVVPRGSPCRCDVPGFGTKRGNAI